MIDEFEFLAEDGEVSQGFAEKGWGTWVKSKIHLSVLFSVFCEKKSIQSVFSFLSTLLTTTTDCIQIHS